MFALQPRPPVRLLACAARSIDRLIVQRMCELAGAQLRSEPGPKPNRTRRYEEIAYCDAPRFVAVHSWTNGDTPPTHPDPKPDPDPNANRKPTTPNLKPRSNPTLMHPMLRCTC